MKSRMLSTFLAGACVAGVLHAGSPPLVVHEWGTFTSFQDAAGKTISGINVDDEPVPRFVHRLRDFENFQTTSMPARLVPGCTALLSGRHAAAGNTGAVLLSTRRLAGDAVRCPRHVRRRLAHRVLSRGGHGGHGCNDGGGRACPGLAALATASPGPRGGIAQAEDRLACLAGAARGSLLHGRE